MLPFFRVLQTSQNQLVRTAGSSRLSLSSHVSQPLSEGKEALNKIKMLYANGHYEEALTEVEMAGKRYPGCSKAAAHYRGKISIALLEERGELESLKKYLNP